MEKYYRLVKVIRKDDGEYLSRTIIGYFPSKKAAMKFAHYEPHVEMWKNEFKKVMSIIDITIELERVDNVEVIWLFE